MVRRNVAPIKQRGDGHRLKTPFQQFLRQGFYHGAVDGTYGPETRRALLNFQRQNGLPESGQIDQDTLGALGMQ